MSKRIKLMFTVSVLLNVLLVGLGGGVAYKHWAAHPWKQDRQELSPEARHIVGRNLQGAFREIKPLGDEARKARAALIKVLSAEDFDADRYDEAALRLSVAKEKMRAKKVEVTKVIASQLSAEERGQMAERMTKMIGGGREHSVRRKRRPVGVRPARKPRGISSSSSSSSSSSE